MPSVNIVVANGVREWIGGRFARELVTRLPAHGFHAAINSPHGADLEYQQIVYGPPTSRPAVGLFTHGEERPRQFARDYDGHITFSPTLALWLLAAGAAHPEIVSYPVDERFCLGRPLVFGVAGRVYQDGRKGEHLVAAAVAAGFDVVAWGSGWPCRIVSNMLGDLPDFYRSLDYYIDTSSDEGGCVPAAEAMAFGVPVISHTVGVTRPVIPYERHSELSLLEVLDQLARPYTYDDFARAHSMAFLRALARAGVVA